MSTTDFGSAPPMFRADGTFYVDLDAPVLTGPIVKLHEVACCISTPLGSLFYDRAKGVTRPLPALMNATPDDATLRRIEVEFSLAATEQVELVALAVFRFRRPTTRSLSLGGVLTLADGLPRIFTASITDVINVLFPQATS